VYPLYGFFQVYIQSLVILNACSALRSWRLSTVIDVLKTFIDNNHKYIGEIHFSAEKIDFYISDPNTDPKDFSKNRANVYNRLIKRNLQNLPLY